MLIRSILNACKYCGDKVAIIDGHSGQSLTYKTLAINIKASANYLKFNKISIVISVGEPSLDDLGLCLSIGLFDGTWIPLADSEQITYVLRNLEGGSKVLILDSTSGTKDLQQSDHSRKSDLNSTPFLITFSSGTTGHPKGVLLDQVTKLHRSQQTIDLFAVGPRDILLSSSPVHHSLGQRHLFVSLLAKGTLVRNVPFTTEGWLFCAKKYNPTFAIPVSTQVKLLEKKNPEFEHSLHSFRALVMSSAPCSSNLKRFLMQHKIDLWETYGCTETAFASAVKLTSSDNLENVGSPLSQVNILVDEQTSEIKVKTPYLCQGYLGQNSVYKACFDEYGFFKTGDRGAWLGKFLQFEGRLGLEFTVAGNRVNPLAIERQFPGLPGVGSIVAVPIPNTIFDHTVGFFFVNDDKYQTTAHDSKKKLFAWAVLNLQKHEIPTQFISINAWPLLPNGKLDRQKLIQSIR